MNRLQIAFNQSETIVAEGISHQICPPFIKLRLYDDTF